MKRGCGMPGPRASIVASALCFALASGEILALARRGDVVITSAAAELELALTEGVRSLAGVFQAH